MSWLFKGVGWGMKVPALHVQGHVTEYPTTGQLACAWCTIALNVDNTTEQCTRII